MRWQDVAMLSVPVGIAAVLVCTARAVVAVVDGPDETLYGFPLFWIKPGPTSLSVIVDVAAIAFDIACYQVLAAVATIAAIRRWPQLAGSRTARVIAWSVVVVVLAGCGAVLSADPSYGGVTFSSSFRWSNIHGYAPYVGVPGRP